MQPEFPNSLQTFCCSQLTELSFSVSFYTDCDSKSRGQTPQNGPALAVWASQKESNSINVLPPTAVHLYLRICALYIGCTLSIKPQKENKAQTQKRCTQKHKMKPKTNL